MARCSSFGVRATSVLLWAALVGCDQPPAPPDAPEPVDARADTTIARPDTGPPCVLECAAPDTCCFVEGAPVCLDLVDDIANCGNCGHDCREGERGDGCAHGMCYCGDVDIGCAGGPHSTCCLSPGGAGRCADILNDFDDCGGCSERCDVTTADRCDAGECSCGDTGAPCGAGTTCCAPALGGDPGRCVDTTSDREHCGECRFRCAAGDVCQAGLCVRPRDAGPLDGGAPDAGSPDGGSPDAGAPDAGSPDAGTEDAGSEDAP